MRRLMAVLITALSLSACGGNGNQQATTAPTPSSPPFINLTGTWTGTAQDTIGGQGTLRATITQTETQFTGTWSLTFPNASYNNGGSLEGVIGATTITGVLRSNLTCPLSVTFLLNTTRSLSGQYASVNCATVTVTGTFALTR